MGRRLKSSTAPYWIDLGYGIWHQVKPLSTAVVGAIRAKAARMAKEMVEAAEAERIAELINLDDLTEEETVAGLSELLFATVLAQAATVDWKGWYDEGEPPQPIPLSDSALAASMRQPFVAERFLSKYLAPYGEEVEEGKGSAPSPTGTMAAAPSIAGAAAS